MASITVGLDFGTHQTKVCVETRDNYNNVKREFLQFADCNGNLKYAIPSQIKVDSDGRLSYGFIEMPSFNLSKPTEPIKGKYPDKPHKPSGTIKNSDYFYNMQIWRKQCENIDRTIKCIDDEYNRKLSEYNDQLDKYNNSLIDYQTKREEWNKRNCLYKDFKLPTYSDTKWEGNIEADCLSIWFLAYILFDLNDRYGKEQYVINLGVPTNADDYEKKKAKVKLIANSALNLVDNVYNGEKELFLKETVDSLKSKTSLIEYKASKYDGYLFVMPEAYAGLMSLTYESCIPSGLNLLIDIGGGTTDISFFSIAEKSTEPKIYDYDSIVLGLSFLSNDRGLIDESRSESHFEELSKSVAKILQNVSNAFVETDFPMQKLHETLDNKGNGRPCVYLGGGATKEELRKGIKCFKDIINNPVIHQSFMNNEALNSILSVALGLSVARLDDVGNIKHVSETFKHLRRIKTDSIQQGDYDD